MKYFVGLAMLFGLSGCSVESGALLPMDATVADSASDVVVPDSCTPRAESCNGADDDCDGSTDEGFDLSRDQLNCGTCGVECGDGLNASGSCEAGMCQTVCNPGFADCDETPGCEADLRDPATCGACGVACATETPLCQGDVASGFSCVASCSTGFTPCGSACVDTATDPAHCGGCDMACSAPSGTATCVASACAVESCDVGYADCDMDVSTGCETATTTLTDCGDCAVACGYTNATTDCSTGSCQLVTCSAGFDDCNADLPTDGCERAVDTVSDCLGCGLVCDIPNAVEVCEVGGCGFSGCDTGYADCDLVVSNGCEGDLSDMETCGACDVRCGTWQSCDPGGCDGSCPVDSCEIGCSAASPCTCTRGNCRFACASSDCDVTCTTDADRCTIEAEGRDDVQVDCSSDNRCRVLARDAGVVNVDCNEDCIIDCRDATVSCDADCRGATCEVRCSGAATCDIQCDRAVVDCGGGDYRCGSECPD